MVIDVMHFHWQRTCGNFHIDSVDRNTQALRTVNKGRNKWILQLNVQICSRTIKQIFIESMGKDYEIFPFFYRAQYWNDFISVWKACFKALSNYFKTEPNNVWYTKHMLCYLQHLMFSKQFFYTMRGLCFFTSGPDFIINGFTPSIAG